MMQFTHGLLLLSHYYCYRIITVVTLLLITVNVIMSLKFLIINIRGGLHILYMYYILYYMHININIYSYFIYYTRVYLTLFILRYSLPT